MKTLLITLTILTSFKAFSYDQAGVGLALGCAIESACSEAEYTELDLEFIKLKEYASIQLEENCDSVQEFISTTEGQQVIGEIFAKLEAQGNPSCY